MAGRKQVSDPVIERALRELWGRRWRDEYPARDQREMIAEMRRVLVASMGVMLRELRRGR